MKTALQHRPVRWQITAHFPESIKQQTKTELPGAPGCFVWTVNRFKLSNGCHDVGLWGLATAEERMLARCTKS